MTLNQLKYSNLLIQNGWKEIDIYEGMELSNRPIPGLMVFYKEGEIGYLGGDGKLYKLEISDQLLFDSSVLDS